MRAIAITLILVLAASVAHAQEAATWRKVAETIPLGSKITLQTLDGKTIKGTLMRADETSVMVKKSTRRPEPAVVVPYDTLSNLERQRQGGIGVGKAIAIGLATGAGVILSMFVIALSLD
jgi:hypothetical protein